MLAPGNAGRVGGAIHISEIIHHSVRREHRRRHLRLDASRLRNAYVMAHFFLFSLFYFFPPLFFPSFISLVNRQLISIVIRVCVSQYRFKAQFVRRSLAAVSKKSTSEYASGLPDSALRSGRFRIMDRTDGRSRQPLFSPSAFHPQPSLPGATSF